MKWIGLVRATTIRGQGLAAALCAALAACGGDGGGDGGDGGAGSGANRATDWTPEYGSPEPATATQAAVMQNGLSTAVSLSSTPSAAAALALASLSPVTSTLLGSTIGLAAATSAPATSRRRGGYEDCITIDDRTITFDGCEVAYGGSTTITDGEVSLSADGGTITWDLNVTSDVAFGSVSSEADFHQSGDITIADGTIRGEMLSELSATATTGGTSFDYEYHEALILDLSYQLDPPCVTGGTLEARRVWETRPDGFPASSAPDRAVLITWTGCSRATLAGSIP